MKAKYVDSKDAPDGYYAVEDGIGSGCSVCEFTGDCSSVRCEPGDREDGWHVSFKKIPVNVPPLVSKKLTIHSNGGNILLCFDGFGLPRISVMNYGDISAQEVAERLLTCWNKHVHESIEAIEEGSK